MNIERLKFLVRGIFDPNEALEAMRILSDAKSYQELVVENAKLKKQLKEEQTDHAAMENGLARARLRAEGERDVALLACSRISEEEFLKRVDARWNGREERETIPDDALNPVGKMILKMRSRIKELETYFQEKRKPESQIQAELLADMYRANARAAMSASQQLAIREVILDAARRFNVYNQMQVILEKI